MPSIGTAADQKKEEGVLITFENTGAANTKFIVANGRRVFNFTINTTLPAGYTAKDKGHLGLYFDSSVTNWTGGTASFPLATFARESDGSGEVQALFSIKVADPSASSANVSYAWGMSVILSAMEGIDLNGDGDVGVDTNGNIVDQEEYETEHAFTGWYDPHKVGITGYSRNGKAVECIAAFAESRGGIRVGHVAIGSAGLGGPALERFLSPAGYYVDGQPADPLPPDAPGLMKFESMIGKPWYMKKTNNGDTTIDGPVVIASAGSADTYRYKAVRGWSPYFETYGFSPTNYGQVTTPYVGWQNPEGVGSGSWSGIQSLSEGRNETRGWFSPRFQEFTDLHTGLDIDHVVGNNDPLYPVDDPIGRFDYYRANWGRPRNGTESQTPTIAERVKKRIPNRLLEDYVAGEARRPRPAYQTVLLPHPDYTTQGPKFKPMDWRGLIDEPETLE
ncbi:MAG: hypothetical protein LBB68_00155 [Treponema sp.]|jgi:hypothetical protein|nr:hypothetical protein [Treponema sp.]